MRDMNSGPKDYGYDAHSCKMNCLAYAYFSLWDGSFCTCDNTYSTPEHDYPRVDDSHCGDSLTGGAAAEAVYESPDMDENKFVKILRIGASSYEPIEGSTGNLAAGNGYAKLSDVYINSFPQIDGFSYYKLAGTADGQSHTYYLRTTKDFHDPERSWGFAGNYALCRGASLVDCMSWDQSSTSFTDINTEQFDSVSLGVDGRMLTDFEGSSQCYSESMTHRCVVAAGQRREPHGEVLEL
jgi:hypothetical protein